MCWADQRPLERVVRVVRVRGEETGLQRRGVARPERRAADVVAVSVPRNGPDVRPSRHRSRCRQGDGKIARRAAAHAAGAAAACELLQVLVEEDDAHPAASIASIDRDIHGAAGRIGGLIGRAAEVDVGLGAARVDAVSVAAIAGGGDRAVAADTVVVVERQGRSRLRRPERHGRQRDRRAESWCERFHDSTSGAVVRVR